MSSRIWHFAESSIWVLKTLFFSKLVSFLARPARMVKVFLSCSFNYSSKSSQSAISSKWVQNSEISQSTPVVTIFYRLPVLRHSVEQNLTTRISSREWRTNKYYMYVSEVSVLNILVRLISNNYEFGHTLSWSFLFNKPATGGWSIFLVKKGRKFFPVLERFFPY